MDYTSHSSADIQTMLDVIGLASVDELIRRVIPSEFLLDRNLDIPEGITEADLVREFSAWAGSNVPAAGGMCFMGGGSYDHYIPAAIANILSRSEFATAYTPYQAEVSQGTLQTIYEFQTMVARLTAMDAANASLYDGATALAEGMLLAVRKTKRNVITVPYSLNPAYLELLKTYALPSGIEIRTLGHQDGRIPVNELTKAMEGSAALVIQHPNFFGLLEPTRNAAEIAHEAGALVISSTYPTSLALLEPPGEWGADIATAEGQPLGVPMSLGGPYVGLFAVKEPLIRLMPGRLVARAFDRNNKQGFVLTLQTREQHIRREKATSNICTNQALIALNTLIYLSLVGPDGLKKAALNSYRGAHYLAEQITHIPGCNLAFGGEFFSEFAVELPRSASEVQKELGKQGILAGPLPGWWLDQPNHMMVAVTERRTKQEMDSFVNALRDIVA